MKNHFNEDTLFKYQLELLEDEEMADVENHINFCESCKSKLDEIKAEINIISSYDPNVRDVQINKIGKRNYYSSWYSSWLKIAAVLLIGFVTGYSTSSILQPDQVMVVGQYLNTNNLNSQIDEFTVCPSVDIFNWGDQR